MEECKHKNKTFEIEKADIPIIDERDGSTMGFRNGRYITTWCADCGKKLNMVKGN